MENSPQNVRHLRLSGLILLAIGIVLFIIAYTYLSQIETVKLARSSPGLCTIVLGLITIINAFNTFKSSTNINENSFAKWQKAQRKFWRNIIIFMFLLALASFCATITSPHYRLLRYLFTCSILISI